MFLEISPRLLALKDCSIFLVFEGLITPSAAAGFSEGLWSVGLGSAGLAYFRASNGVVGLTMAVVGLTAVVFFLTSVFGSLTSASYFFKGSGSFSFFSVYGSIALIGR